MKVLGIGLGRTGTTSLASALEILGYKTKHCPRFYLDPKGALCIAREDIENHEALTDEPCIIFFGEADREFPGSKFILTVREMGAWLSSVENNSASMQEWWASNPAVSVLHTVLYGSAAFDRRLYAEAHQRHLAGVHEYFKDRPTDLLVIDICGGEGWKKLCPFLGKPIPNDKFPRRNVFGESDWSTVAKKRGIRLGQQDW